MKKTVFHTRNVRLGTLLLALLLLALCCAIPAAAYDASLPRVIDSAGQLSAAEETQLAAKIAALSEENGCDIILLTQNCGYGGKTAEAYTDDYYDSNGYGCGADNSGIIFMYDTADRYVHISTAGTAIKVFSDYGIDRLIDVFADTLYSGGTFTAYTEFLEALPSYFEAAESGKPIDVYGDGNDAKPYYPDDGSNYNSTLPFGVRLKNAISSGTLLVCFGIAFVISIIIMLGVRRGMNTARIRTTAEECVQRDSFRLTRQQDLFLYSRTRRIQHAQPSNSSSRGGSSFHTSSGGVSHGGGGRHI